MAKQSPFAPTLRITDDLAVRIINGEKVAVDALGHFVRHYVMNMLEVHNPYHDPKVQEAMHQARRRGYGNEHGQYPAHEVQDFALYMVDVDAPATPEQIARINDRSTWKTCPCNPLNQHPCQD